MNDNKKFVEIKPEKRKINEKKLKWMTTKKLWWLNKKKEKLMRKIKMNDNKRFVEIKSEKRKKEKLMTSKDWKD